MELILEKYNDTQIAKAKKIKAIIFDVDGVLTNGGIIYSNSGDEQKIFNVKDGQIMKHLRAHNFLTGAITGRVSELVDRRCKELKLDFHYQDIRDKYGVFQTILDNYNLKEEEVAYIGDDIIDLKIIKHAGLGICPADAIEYVKPYADIITAKKGGEGVLRESADFILAAQGLLENIVLDYEGH